MASLKAHVQNGRLVVDQPTTLPEGTEVSLMLADEEGDLDPAEQAALDEALQRSWQSAQAGRTAPASELLARLAQRK